MKRVNDTNGNSESAFCTVNRLQAAKSMILGAIPSGDKKL